MPSYDPAAVAALIKAATKLCAEPADLRGVQTFWTETGLYGRVGKESARTLLARHAAVCAALAAIDAPAKCKTCGGTREAKVTVLHDAWFDGLRKTDTVPCPDCQPAPAPN